jgi:hypothetical protein
MSYSVGEKSISYTGREPFRLDDADFEAALLATGCFENLEDGTMRYSGKVSVKDKACKEHQVDARGYLSLSKDDMPNGKDRKDFI